MMANFMKHVSIPLALFALICACDERAPIFNSPDTEVTKNVRENDPREQDHINNHTRYPREDGDYSGRYDQLVSLSLRLGHLKASGEFIDVAQPIHSSPTTQFKHVQLAAILEFYTHFDPNHIRIEFTSDRSIWVGLNGIESLIFPDEESCLDNGLFCEEVITGESTSGYFDAGMGYRLGIANFYCDTLNLPYVITFTAWAVNIAEPTHPLISQPTHMSVDCVH